MRHDRPDVPAILDHLKGFQRDSVEYAFERLYEADDSSHRFLVADEVGLGKTLVARGVVTRAVDHLWDDVERVDIVYICSNANIARQNVRRLSPFQEDETHRVDRLTLLPTAVRDLKERKVNFVAFTPGTSFNLRSSGGRWQERVVLYWLLQDVWPRKGTGPKNLMQGRVESAQTFRWRLDEFTKKNEIDPGLAEAFANRIEGQVIEDRQAGRPTLKERYDELCDRFHYFRQDFPAQDRHDQFAFIGELRALLAGTCLDALEPDLVILDEFQRFKDLLDGDDEAATLAQRLFEYSSEDDPDVRLLLLSATPYKMYTLHHEAHEDDHYTDFLRTVKFLGGDDTAHEVFKEDLDDYRRELYRLAATDGAERLQELKGRIEAHLRKQMCRTERVRSTESSDGMLTEVPTPGVSLTADDVADFRSLARVAERVGQPGVVEYWKSAPYLLSFMDNYKLKTEFKELLETEGLGRQMLEDIRPLTFPWEDFERYGAVDPRNARVRAMNRWLEETEAWKLLWLPPTLPYHRLEGPFEKAAGCGLTKRLIFSSWAVVPKAIASMLSYEAERRIFEGERSGVASPEERSERRPLLRFTRTKERLTGMPVLGILYPSLSLAEIGDPLSLAGMEPLDAEHARGPDRTEVSEGLEEAEDNAGFRGPGLDQVVAQVRDSLAERLEPIVKKHANPEKPDDEAWYWAAPLLLDLERCPEETRAWFANRDLPTEWASGDDEPDTGWNEHIECARAVLEDDREHPDHPPLGPPPDDLEDVLSLMALASPGSVALRALSRSGLGGLEFTDPALRLAAAKLAWGFRSLFNQPEALAIIRGGWTGSEETPEATPYWQLVLHYGAAGCLQAVLDEYTHLVRDLDGWIDSSPEETVHGVAESVLEALTLRTTLSHVDQIQQDGGPSGLRINSRRLRNHFALRFGNQDTEEGAAGIRIDRVRGAFNSPFWPFVLATTSVGQEGLDFHAYSHAVVHWNLPSNPVDLEQREGRVHRYKGHAVRKNVAEGTGTKALQQPEGDAWERLFALAADGDGLTRGLRPYWVCPGQVSIERHVPRLPLSRDEHQYAALQRSLAVYRMVFGQPRQDDLMAFLLERLGPERIEELMPMLRIELAPRARLL